LCGEGEDGVVFPADEIEVPPFGRQSYEALLSHDLFKKAAVVIALRLLGDVAAMSTFGKLVERGGHGELLALFIEEGDIDGSASCVSAPFRRGRYIPLILDDIPEDLLNSEGAVAVPYFESEALFF
jgi:hypothetical protein